MPQAAGRLLQGQQRTQDQRGIMVMDAALVAFAVARCGKRTHALVQCFGRGDVVLQRGQVKPVAPLLRGHQQAAGQILAAIQHR